MMAETPPSPPRLPLVRKFRDPLLEGKFVHLSAPSCRVVDSPPFQRLRFLHQLGVAQFVYPSATHTRFAHSLGVAHRARELLAALAARQPELGVDSEDLLCAELAGLCHDLGHGPLSHSFEGEVVPRMAAAGELPPGLHGWRHERMSCALLDLISADYAVGLAPHILRRVKALIDPGSAAADPWPAAKSFMYDLVANKRSGLDVDRLDYLLRDNAACAALSSADFSCITESARVVGGEVCFRCPPSAVAGVYHARALLHEHVYHHPVLKGIEYMATDALYEARSYLGIAEALADPRRFVLLDDTVLRELRRCSSPDPGVRAARRLLECLEARDIYKFCGAVEVPPAKAAAFEAASEAAVAACWGGNTAANSQQPGAGWQSQGAGELQPVAPGRPHGPDLGGDVPELDPGSASTAAALQLWDAAQVVLRPCDIRVTRLRIDWSAGWRNPVDEVGFWTSRTDQQPQRRLRSKFEPAAFASLEVRVYLCRLCDSPEEKAAYMAAARGALAEWNARHVQASQVRSPAKSHQTASARKRPASAAAGVEDAQLSQAEVQQRPDGASRAGLQLEAEHEEKRRRELLAEDVE